MFSAKARVRNGHLIYKSACTRARLFTIYLDSLDIGILVQVLMYPISRSRPGRIVRFGRFGDIIGAVIPVCKISVGFLLASSQNRLFVQIHQHKSPHPRRHFFLDLSLDELVSSFDGKDIFLTSDVTFSFVRNRHVLMTSRHIVVSKLRIKH